MTALFRRRSRARGHAVAALILVVVAQAGGTVPARASGGTLAVDAVTIEEPAAGVRAVVFMVTLGRTDDSVVTVEYATADDTATAGQDYVAVRGSLDFGSAGTTRTVRVTVLGDGIDEADETFDLRLTGASTAQADLAGTATIADADGAPRLSIGDARVTEGDAGATTAAFAVSLSDPSGLPVTVDFATGDTAAPGAATRDTATRDTAAVAPGDFSATAGTLTFSPGQQMATIAVPVTGDTADESDETFTVSLSGATNAAIPTSAGRGTATIVDDDGVPALSVGDATVTEGDSGATHATFRVSLDRPSSQNVTFRVETAEGTGPSAARAPDDYQALRSTNEQIVAGQTAVDIDVHIAGDLIHEGTETFDLVLSSEANAILARAIGTATITDNDVGPDVSVADATVAEGTLVGPNLQFTISLSVPAGKDVTVEYATADGTAVGSATPDERDFTPVAGDVVFTTGETEKTVTVFVAHDGLAEGAETVRLDLTGVPEGIGIAQGAATGTINDDDGPPDELAVNDIIWAEGDRGAQGHLFTVTRTTRSAGILPTITVRYGTGDGSARAGSDYTPRSGLLVFTGSTTTQTISVSVGGDVLDEDEETFTVTLSDPTNAVIVKATGTATIRDDDAAPLLSVSGGRPETTGQPATATVVEGNGGSSGGLVAVTLSAPSSKPVTVAYSVGGGTATAADYGTGTIPGTLTFAPGETDRAVRVTVTGDTLDEADETFQVTLSSPVNAGLGAAVGAVTIADDDAPPAVSIGDATINEADAAPTSPLVFTVALGRVSGQPVTVTLDTADGTATAPGDYVAVRRRAVTIPAGVGAVAVAVTVLDDGDQDSAASETFTATLASPVNATMAAGTGTGRITDDDGPASLSVTGDTVTEGTGGSNRTAIFVVMLSRPRPASVTVDYATGDGPVPGGAESPGDAESPADFTATTGVLTFDAGQTVRTVAVSVVPDNGDETTETFTLGLSNPTDAVLDIGPSATTAAATVVDDDGPAVRVADITVAEGNRGTGTAVFEVVLDAASVQPATVAWATADGTAAGGRDYTAANGSLLFAPGDTAKTVAVEVTGDAVNEADEEFFLTLGPAADAELTDAAGRAVIANDDLAQLDIADANVVEGDSGVTGLTFTVTLTPPSSSTVTASFASGDGTAHAGDDYAAVSGGVTFNPGDRLRTFVVGVTGDTTDKLSETFQVALSGVSAGARFGQAVATGTVIDDDGLPDIASPDVTVTEKTGEEATAVFPVRLSAPRSFAVTVHFETLPGTSSAATDFTPVSGDLTFAPGDEEQRVPVAVRGDNRAEADETIRLRLSSPGGGVVPDAEALATIVDDDAPGYLLAGTDGGVFTFGGAPFLGSAGHLRLNRPIVGVAAHPQAEGYWLVATDGGIFSFGAARFFGSTGATRLNKPIVGMAPTPTGDGYWLVATDGGIFSFGDARFLGSTGATKLNKPIVGMAPTPTGQGYWLVATDGGIFSFGDARFFGSTGATALSKPIVGMAPTPTGDGYWLVATDGGIFAFGDAAFHGSTGARQLNRPIVGMASTPGGKGYWLVATDGGVFAFGDAVFLGSTGATRLNKSNVGVATV